MTDASTAQTDRQPASGAAPDDPDLSARRRRDAAMVAAADPFKAWLADDPANLSAGGGELLPLAHLSNTVQALPAGPSALDAAVAAVRGVTLAQRAPGQLADLIGRAAGGASIAVPTSSLQQWTPGSPRLLSS